MSKLLSIFFVLALLSCLFTTSMARQWYDQPQISHYQLNRYPNQFPPGHPANRGPYPGRPYPGRLSENSLGMFVILLVTIMGFML